MELIPVGPQHGLRSQQDFGAELRQAYLAAEKRVAAAGRKISKQRLAKQVGISTSSLYAYLAGATLPGSEILDRLLVELGLDGATHGRLASLRDEVEVVRRQPPATIPQELPADISAFTGRRSELAELNSLLPSDAKSRTVVIWTVTGMAGIGKTALAVHWAHRVTDHFPDGQLYVNLRGFDNEQPLRPIHALARLMRALGVAADQIPADVDEAAGMYRGLLASRRVLVVLDNAGSAEQVRPLLPGAPGCLCVITSRDRLSGLIAVDGACRLTLKALALEEAIALLAAIAGADRVAAEPEAASALAAACELLPLALRIAAAQLADHPHWTIDEYVGTLTHDRLGALRIDERTAVRVVLDQSYARLPDRARTMLRTLALFPGSDVSLEAAAAGAAMTSAEAEQAIEALVHAHLLEQRQRERYQLHDLIREFAQGCAAGSRSVTRQRFFDWYLASLDDASALLYPDMLRLPVKRTGDGVRFSDRAGAMAWLEAELPNLLTLIRHTAVHGPYHYAWLVTDRLFGYFWHVRSIADWIEVTQAAVEAATKAEDGAGCAAALSSQGTALKCVGRLEESFVRFESAVDYARQAGWTEGEARAELRLGTAHYDLGRLAQAQHHLEQAQMLYERAGYRTGLAVALNNLGVLARKRGRLNSAAKYCEQALAHYQEMSADAGIAQALGNLGLIQHGRGRLRQAHTFASKSLTLERKAGRRYGMAVNLCNLALILCDLGRCDAAAEHAARSVELAREIRKPREEASALAAYATVMSRSGCVEEANRNYQLALKAAADAAAPDVEAEALIGWAHLHRAEGRLSAALTDAGAALRIAHEGGYQLIGAMARSCLAAAHLQRGAVDVAQQHVEQALEFLQAEGARQEEGRALLIFGDILQAADQPQAAQRLWRKAWERLRGCSSADAHSAKRL